MATIRTTEKPFKVTCEFDEVEYFYLLHLLNSDIGETRGCLEKIKKNPNEKHLAVEIEKGLGEVTKFYESINMFNLPLEGDIE